MNSVFLDKLNKNEYISNFLFLNTNKNEIPKDFNLESYNNKVLNKMYLKYKDYFDTMYKDIDDNIKLDDEQIKTILADEDYSLIIAGAGTGKTTTMVSKVKYLVEIKKVDPSKILVMSYTKKATEELEKRLVYDFNLEVDIKTFHSLGYDIIKKVYAKNVPYVVDENLKNDIFLKWFKNSIFNNKSKLEKLINLFPSDDYGNWYFSKYFRENYFKYNSFEEYFNNYKKKRLKEAGNNLNKIINEKIDNDINAEYPITICGELVKSKGEAVIANFLYTHNIDYEYEKVYDEILPNYKVYKPDFTINVGGRIIYIEYFGLSGYRKNEYRTYEKIKALKIKYHEEKHNTLIKIDYLPNEDIEKTLEQELLKLNIKLTRKSDEEIFNTIIEKNKLAEIYPLRKLFFNCIDQIKSSINREQFIEIVKNYLKNDLNKEKLEQFKFIYEFYYFYQMELFSHEKYGFDYADMIYYAKANLNRNKNLVNYDYIIIDEYQDISEERYELAYSIANNNHTKVTAVGDDWQTIFSFSGSKIEYIYNFAKYFKGAKLFKITTTYRNPKDLVKASSQFIMKNDLQIKKELQSFKEINNSIKFVLYDVNEELNKTGDLPYENVLEVSKFKETEKLKEIIKKIYETNPNHNILILSRKNNTIKQLYNDNFFINDLGTKLTIKSMKDLEIDAMSIHKSKGLTADEVIIIGLDEYFPLKDRNSFWLINLFKNQKIDEPIEDAEERRVFYVALTRTKNNVYILTNKNRKHRSKFIDELFEIYKENQKD